jgi:hypothetical protein
VRDVSNANLLRFIRDDIMKKWQNIFSSTKFIHLFVTEIIFSDKFWCVTYFVNDIGEKLFYLVLFVSRNVLLKNLS